MAVFLPQAQRVRQAASRGRYDAFSPESIYADRGKFIPYLKITYNILINAVAEHVQDIKTVRHAIYCPGRKGFFDSFTLIIAH